MFVVGVGVDAVEIKICAASDEANSFPFVLGMWVCLLLFAASIMNSVLKVAYV